MDYVDSDGQLQNDQSTLKHLRSNGDRHEKRWRKFRPQRNLLWLKPLVVKPSVYVEDICIADVPKSGCAPASHSSRSTPDGSCSEYEHAVRVGQPSGVTAETKQASKPKKKKSRQKKKIDKILQQPLPPPLSNTGYQRIQKMEESRTSQIIKPNSIVSGRKKNAGRPKAAAAVPKPNVPISEQKMPDAKANKHLFQMFQFIRSSEQHYPLPFHLARARQLINSPLVYIYGLSIANFLVRFKLQSSIDFSSPDDPGNKASKPPINNRPIGPLASELMRCMVVMGEVAVDFAFGEFIRNHRQFQLCLCHMLDKDFIQNYNQYKTGIN